MFCADPSRVPFPVFEKRRDALDFDHWRFDRLLAEGAIDVGEHLRD